jgi:hypothetical protein
MCFPLFDLLFNNGVAKESINVEEVLAWIIFGVETRLDTPSSCLLFCGPLEWIQQQDGNHGRANGGYFGGTNG